MSVNKKKYFRFQSTNKNVQTYCGFLIEYIQCNITCNMKMQGISQKKKNNRILEMEWTNDLSLNMKWNIFLKKMYNVSFLNFKIMFSTL